MQFLSMVRVNEHSSQRPDEKLMQDMGVLMQEMTAAGYLLDTAGLRPSSEGVRLKLANGTISRTDGPFTETKEVIGGFALPEASSMEQALALTRRFLEVHGDRWNLECEVRQLERHPCS